MIGVRLTFYVLFVLLGLVILVRTLAIGLHWESVTAVIFSLALMALGLYRIRLWSTRR